MLLAVKTRKRWLVNFDPSISSSSQSCVSQIVSPVYCLSVLMSMISRL